MIRVSSHGIFEVLASVYYTSMPWLRLPTLSAYYNPGSSEAATSAAGGHTFRLKDGMVLLQLHGMILPILLSGEPAEDSIGPQLQ